MNEVNKQLFAVMLTEGGAWQQGRPMEQQQDWQGHAAFMEGLVSERFIVVGGPLEGTPDRLHIVWASSADEIRARLAADPWARLDLLRVKRIDAWTLRLGSLP